jgi:hypothetical protein
LKPSSTDRHEHLIASNHPHFSSAGIAGGAKKVLTPYAGGLRASLGYCGCKTVPEMQRKARLVRVSTAGLYEAHPYDVKIMKEAPNDRS